MSAGREELLFVAARIHRCGCTTAYTVGKHAALAEATYCPEGLRLARALKEQRDLVRGTDFADGRWEGRFGRLEEIEAELHSHRLRAGVLHRWRVP